MVSPARGSVVLVRFPFSDLSSSKLRPAVALASAGRGDWVPSQITSNPYADTQAVMIGLDDLSDGSLQRISYARPGKLFTANVSLMATAAGQLTEPCFERVLHAVVELLQGATEND